MIVHTPQKGQTQTAGAFEFVFKGSGLRANSHHIQVEVSAAPSGGTLDVDGRAIGSTTFQFLGQIDLTATSLAYIFEGNWSAVQCTPTSFDVGKTFNTYLTSTGEV